MNYYDNKKNVKGYIKMAEGYDGRELIEILKKYLPPKSSVLELGMGPGKDLDILKESFSVTGSDISQIFLDMYKEKDKDADLLLLNAHTLETNRKFDSIYSNKVLHHLTTDELKLSFQRQKELLNDGGLLFHSFWEGDKEEENHGLRFVYYTRDKLVELVSVDYEVLEIIKYGEFEDNDSIFLILRKR